MVKALIRTYVRASLQLHEVLHRLRDRRVTGTATMELKLAQEHAIIDQYPLFLIFLYLRKSYDTVDRERPLITLEGYGAGPRLCGIL